MEVSLRHEGMTGEGRRVIRVVVKDLDSGVTVLGGTAEVEQATVGVFVLFSRSLFDSLTFFSSPRPPTSSLDKDPKNQEWEWNSTPLPPSLEQFGTPPIYIWEKFMDSRSWRLLERTLRRRLCISVD